MFKEKWLQTLSQESQIKPLLETNQYTETFGLTLSKKDTLQLMEERAITLKHERRIEFGQGILNKLIYAFCDSAYIIQENYCDTLIQLQQIFYLYKNEIMDEITDDELIKFMRDSFENICFGDLDYLAGTCLDIFAQAIRAGYTKSPFAERDVCFNEYLDVVSRWDRQLYLDTLKELLER